MYGCGQCLRISSPKTNSVEVLSGFSVYLDTVCVDLFNMGVHTHFHPHTLFLHGNVHVYMVCSDHNGDHNGDNEGMALFLDKY